jgi:hypothetical protein
MARRDRPRHGFYNFGGVVYEGNLAVCRIALVSRQVDREFDSMEGLADAVGCSRSTASRFFSGRPVRLSVALAILGKLKLSFDQVFTPYDPGNGSNPPE